MGSEMCIRDRVYRNIFQKNSSETISSIDQDVDENIWLGTRDGLFLVQNYKYSDPIEILQDDQFSFGRVSNINCVDDNIVWVTTLGDGAFCIKNNKIIELSEYVEPSSKLMNTSMIINDSIICLATNNGIDVYQFNWERDLQIKFLRNINNFDGLASNYVNDIEYWNCLLYTSPSPRDS